jgi:hypothetical protein
VETSPSSGIRARTAFSSCRPLTLEDAANVFLVATCLAAVAFVSCSDEEKPELLGEGPLKTVQAPPVNYPIIFLPDPKTLRARFLEPQARAECAEKNGDFFWTYTVMRCWKKRGGLASDIIFEVEP